MANGVARIAFNRPEVRNAFRPKTVDELLEALVICHESQEIGVVLITTTSTIVNKFNNITTSVGYFLYGGLIIHLISFLLFIYDPLKIDINTFIIITIASVFINLAIFLSTYAFKVSQKYYASIFCLVYLQIVWSSIVGFYFFDEYLNTLAFLGAILIVLSGLISIPGQMKQVNEK